MLPAISLAYESKESQIMTRPPRNASRDFLVNPPLLIIAYLHYGVLLVGNKQQLWGAGSASGVQAAQRTCYFWARSRNTPSKTGPPGSHAGLRRLLCVCHHPQ